MSNVQDSNNAAQPDTIATFLRESPGGTASQAKLEAKFGVEAVTVLLDTDSFETFLVRPKDDWIKVEDRTWVRLPNSNARTALAAAMAATRIPDEWWEPLIELSGAQKRKSARESATARSKVLARTYLIEGAAAQMSLRVQQLEPLVSSGRIASFVDPAGRTRIPAEAIEQLSSDPVRLNALFAQETVKLRDLAIYLGIPLGSIAKRLGNGIHNPGARVTWGAASHRLWPKGDAPLLQDFRRQVEQNRVKLKTTKRELRSARKLEHVEKQTREVRERDDLRSRLLAAFPTWRHARRDVQQLTLHVGPPNSGKTYTALEALKTSGNGWYLAPLRLLAFEIYDRLNNAGVPCNLLTGEESIQRDGAMITAATVEMFDPSSPARCIVLDEAQMIADSDRGWAWTRAMMEAQAADIHVITSNAGRMLIERLAAAAAIPLIVSEHERLTPIAISDHYWTLETLPNRTILVAFSRRMVLQLKAFLENFKRTVSVVYGSLPPEVRRKQADRFASGETQICVATDAVGMGLNLPADFVCFYEVEKFDGKQVRELTPSEIQQIGGRAGRFGLSEGGTVGATDKYGLRVINELFTLTPPSLTFARIAPEVEDLAMIPGTLADRFARWQQLSSIPDDLRDLVKPADIDERVALATMLKDRDVQQLGLDAAVRMVNAPTRESTRMYWYSCAERIIGYKSMPLPPTAPPRIENGRDLEFTEHAIACADIYLWLSQRDEFSASAPEADEVREQRTNWSMNIDSALMHNLDTRARCTNCGRPLPMGHRFGICDKCYRRRQSGYGYW